MTDTTTLYPITGRHSSSSARATIDALRQWWGGDVADEREARDARFDWVCWMRVEQDPSLQAMIASGVPLQRALFEMDIDMLDAMDALRQRAFISLYASETVAPTTTTTTATTTTTTDDDTAVVVRVVVLCCTETQRIVDTIRRRIKAPFSPTPLTHAERVAFQQAAGDDRRIVLNAASLSCTPPLLKRMVELITDAELGLRTLPLLAPIGADGTMCLADTLPAPMMHNMCLAAHTINNNNASLDTAIMHVDAALQCVNYDFVQCSSLLNFLSLIGASAQRPLESLVRKNASDVSLLPTDVVARRLLALTLRCYCRAAYRFESDAARALELCQSSVPLLRCFPRPPLPIVAPMTPEDPTSSPETNDDQNSLSNSATAWRVSYEDASALRRSIDSRLVTIHVRKREQQALNIAYAAAAQVALYGSSRGGACEALAFNVANGPHVFSACRCDALESVLFRGIRAGGTCSQLACLVERNARIHALVTGADAERAASLLVARMIESLKQQRFIDAHDLTCRLSVVTYSVSANTVAIVVPTIVVSSAQLARHLVTQWWREARVTAKDVAATLQWPAINKEGLFHWPLGTTAPMLRSSALSDRLVHAPRSIGATNAAAAAVELCRQAHTGTVFAHSTEHTAWLVESGGHALHSLIDAHARHWPQDAEPWLIFVVSPVLHGMSSPLADDDVGVSHTNSRAVLTWRALHIPLYWTWLKRAMDTYKQRYSAQDNWRAQSALDATDRWMSASVRTWADGVREIRRAQQQANSARPRSLRSSLSHSGGGSNTATNTTVAGELRISLHDGTYWGVQATIARLAQVHALDPLITQVVVLLSVLRELYAEPYKSWIRIGFMLHTIHASRAMEDVYHWWSKTYGGVKYNVKDWASESESSRAAAGVRWRSFPPSSDTTARNTLASLTKMATEVTKDASARIAMAREGLLSYVKWRQQA